MSILSRIARTIASVPKRLKAVATVVSTLAVVSGAVYAGFTPDRPVYDWNNPADRKGSENGPVFNSFINTPYYGDERAFFDAYDSANNVTKDVLPYVTTGSRDIVLRTYVHNNANTATNASGLGVARNTKVRIDLPTGTNTALRARSYISASNATEVTDTTELVDSRGFSISYVAGSAKMYNQANKSGLAISDSVVTTGALIGYDKADGNLPGCFDYQTYVEIHIKVNVPDVSIKKEVKSPTDTAWQKEATVKPGDTTKWIITVTNTGTSRNDETTVDDVLPPHMSVVPGSVKRTDGANSGVVQNDSALFTTGGINFKSYAPSAVLYIRFDTVAKDDFEGCEVRIRNIAKVHTSQNPTDKQDTADVIIKKQNCTPPQKVVTCDALTAPKLTAKAGEQVEFTAGATAKGGATISSYQFFVNGNSVQNTTSNKYTFSQNAAGDYTVKVIVKSSEGDKTSAACEKKITVTKENDKSVKCDALTAPKYTLKTGESTVFTAKGTATNTTITSYEFSVNGKVVQDTASDTYTFKQDATGAYTVHVEVKSPIGTTTSSNCEKTVDVVKEMTPIYRCDALTLSASSVKVGDKVKVTVRFTAKDGAAFKLATFKFGDEKNAQDMFVTNKVTNDTVEAEHTYSAKGSYGIRVKLDFDVNGQTKSVEGEACVGQVTVDVPPTTPPVEIPNTGAGNVAAIFAGVTAAGAFMHNMIARRSIKE